MPDIKTETTEEQSEPKESFKGTVLGEREILKNAVAQAFDLDNTEASKYKDKINTILDYAKTQTDSLTPANIKWVIRNMELKLGSPPLSENRISQVSRYAYLHQERAKLNDEMQQLNPFEE